MIVIYNEWKAPNDPTAQMLFVRPQTKSVSDFNQQLNRLLINYAPKWALKVLKENKIKPAVVLCA